MISCAIRLPSPVILVAPTSPQGCGKRKDAAGAGRDHASPPHHGCRGGVAALACRLLRPLLLRYALARPNARSSHTTPTPQGGGIALLIGMLAALGLVIAAGFQAALPEIGLVMAAALLLGGVGAWDDIRPLSPAVRLVLQALGVSLVVLSLPPLACRGCPPGWSARSPSSRASGS